MKKPTILEIMCLILNFACYFVVFFIAYILLVVLAGLLD